MDSLSGLRKLPILGQKNAPRGTFLERSIIGFGIVFNVVAGQPHQTRQLAKHYISYKFHAKPAKIP